MSKVNGLMNGMDIIIEYEANPWMSSSVDVIYVGEQDGPAFMKMKAEDYELMRIAGWRKSNSMRCWMYKLV